MQLKNFLILSNDVNKSVNFYENFFGLYILKNFGANIIMTEKLVIQDKKAFSEEIEENISLDSFKGMLYFEEENILSFNQKIKEKNVKIVSQLQKDCSERIFLRICDPDDNIIEIKETLNGCIKRLKEEGCSLEKICEITGCLKEHIAAVCGTDI